MRSTETNPRDWLDEHGFQDSRHERIVDGWTRRTPLAQAASEGKLVIVEWLLENGGRQDLGKVGAYGWTAFGLACQQGHLKVAQCLYEHSPNREFLTLRSEGGWSPLRAALTEGHTHLAKWLILNGALNRRAQDTDLHLDADRNPAETGRSRRGGAAGGAAAANKSSPFEGVSLRQGSAATNAMMTTTERAAPREIKQSVVDKELVRYETSPAHRSATNHRPMLLRWAKEAGLQATAMHIVLLGTLPERSGHEDDAVPQASAYFWMLHGQNEILHRIVSFAFSAASATSQQLLRDFGEALEAIMVEAKAPGGDKKAREDREKQEAKEAKEKLKEAFNRQRGQRREKEKQRTASVRDIKHNQRKEKAKIARELKGKKKDVKRRLREQKNSAVLPFPGAARPATAGSHKEGRLGCGEE